MIRHLWPALSLFVKAIIVVLFFVMDVRVRADVTVESVHGSSEITAGDKGAWPKDIETGKRTRLSLKLVAQDKPLRDNLWIDVSTLAIVLDQHHLQLPYGRVMVQVPPEDSSAIHLTTPHGDVIVDSSTKALIQVADENTTVTTVEGHAWIVDRSQNVKWNVFAGATSWIGGLMPAGQREHGALTPFDLEDTLETLAFLDPTDNKELDHRRSELSKTWQAAINHIASTDQSSVARAVAFLNERQKQMEGRNRQQAHLRRVLHREFFYRDALGLDVPRRPASH